MEVGSNLIEGCSGGPHAVMAHPGHLCGDIMANLATLLKARRKET